MNKFQFMGRLTRDPEERSTNSGTTVTAFSIAVNRRFADKTTGERQADFFNLSAFGKIAEFVSKYFKKGSQVLVCGRIQNRTYDDKDGNKRYATDFIVDETYFADSKRADSERMPMPEDSGSYITVDDTVDLPF